MISYLRKSLGLLFLPTVLLTGCVAQHTFSPQTSALANEGMQILQRGAKVTIILASDDFFYFATPTIKPSRYLTLDKLAKLIKRSAKYPVEVRGYTDNVGSENRNREHSLQQAQSIVSYFWTQDIPAQCLDSSGWGSQYPIADNITVQGNHTNRHIEISFWTERV